MQSFLQMVGCSFSHTHGGVENGCIWKVTAIAGNHFSLPWLWVPRRVSHVSFKVLCTWPSSSPRVATRLRRVGDVDDSTAAKWRYRSIGMCRLYMYIYNIAYVNTHGISIAQSSNYHSKLGKSTNWKGCTKRFETENWGTQAQSWETRRTDTMIKDIWCFGGSYRSGRKYSSLLHPSHIRLMEEFPHHLRYIKPLEIMVDSHINWLAGFLPSTHRDFPTKKSSKCHMLSWWNIISPADRVGHDIPI